MTDDKDPFFVVEGTPGEALQIWLDTVTQRVEAAKQAVADYQEGEREGNLARRCHAMRFLSEINTELGGLCLLNSQPFWEQLNTLNTQYRNERRMQN